MQPEEIIVVGKTIKIIEDPSKELMANFPKTFFTGITHHPWRRQVSWTIWVSGQTIRFVKNREEAIAVITKELEFGERR